MAHKKKQKHMSGAAKAATSVPAKGSTAVDLPAGNLPGGSLAGPSLAEGVRRSTMYFAVCIALVAGLYAGTLLPSFLRGMDSAALQAPAGQAGQGAGAPAEDLGALPAQNSGNAPANTPGNAPAPGSANTLGTVPGNGPAPAPQASPSIGAHILELEQTVLKNPKDLAAWINLGNLYFDTHKHKGAINAYQQALKMQPNNADVLTDLGIMYREEKMYEQAVQAFAKAVRLNPRHQNALFNQGVVLYYDLGRKEAGRAAWRQLLALNPQAKAPDGKLVRDMVEGR